AIESLEAMDHKKLHVVMGSVDDKDIHGMLKFFPKKASYYFVKASVPRALDAATLCKMAKRHKLSGKSFDNVEAGIKAAKKAAKVNDIIFIGGSTFVVADALASL